VVLRRLLAWRLRARDTVIFDTPTRAATSAIVTCAALGEGSEFSGFWPPVRLPTERSVLLEKVRDGNAASRRKI
jgi:hypothetical protein